MVAAVTEPSGPCYLPSVPTGNDCTSCAAFGFVNVAPGASYTFGCDVATLTSLYSTSSTGPASGCQTIAICF
jgi:hypothetical protein